MSTFRKALALHNTPPAGAASPFNVLAPSLRFGPKRSRAFANASFTNSLLPITAPSVIHLASEDWEDYTAADGHGLAWDVLRKV